MSTSFLLITVAYLGFQFRNQWQGEESLTGISVSDTGGSEAFGCQGQGRMKGTSRVHEQESPIVWLWTSSFRTLRIKPHSYTLNPFNEFPFCFNQTQFLLPAARNSDIPTVCDHRRNCWTTLPVENMPTQQKDSTSKLDLLTFHLVLRELASCDSDF